MTYFDLKKLVFMIIFWMINLFNKIFKHSIRCVPLCIHWRYVIITEGSVGSCWCSSIFFRKYFVEADLVSLSFNLFMLFLPLESFLDNEFYVYISIICNKNNVLRIEYFLHFLVPWRVRKISSGSKLIKN